MKNKTQCPNCLTVYVISDEQYMRSKGKVRCGTCRTPFQANFFADTPKPIVNEPAPPPAQAAIDNKITAASKNVETENSTEKLTIPSFNIQLPEKQPAPYSDQLLPIDNEASDPVNDSSSENKVSVDNFIAEKVNLVSEEDDSFGFTTELSVNDLSDEELEEYAAQQFDDEIEAGAAAKLEYSLENNIQSELSIEMGDEPDVFDEEIIVDDQDEDRGGAADQEEAEQVANPETALVDEDESSEEATTVEEPTNSDNTESAPQQADLNLETESSNSQQVETHSQSYDAPQDEVEETGLDQKLINKVDELIDDKLGGEFEDKAKTDEPDTESLKEDKADSSGDPQGEAKLKKEEVSDSEVDIETDTVVGDGEDSESFELLLDKPFILDQPVNKIHRWVYSPILILLSLVFILTMAYQLWLRQATPLLEDKRLSDAIAPFTGPIVAGLENRLDIRLPVRRDLANLQLVSARTETHPTRASTTLLRVSMVNQSQIAQPYPWLELSLTDENGRLVARRALSPDDYLYNNRLDNLIGANELRPVTIELLSFPEQARGYELKLLSN